MDGGEVDRLAVQFDAFSVYPCIFPAILANGGGWPSLILGVFMAQERNELRATPGMTGAMMSLHNDFFVDAARDTTDALELHSKLLNLFAIFQQYYDFTPCQRYHDWTDLPANFCPAFAAIDIYMRNVLVNDNEGWDSQFRTWTEENTRERSPERFYSSVHAFVTGSHACSHAILTYGHTDTTSISAAGARLGGVD